MLQKAYLTYLQKYYPQYLNHYYSRKETKDFIVNEFTSFSEDEYNEQICIKDSVVHDFLNKYMLDCIEKKPFLLFNKIEIETINQCNNTCAFCPVNVHLDKRQPMVMAKELFQKIIFQLEELHYSGAINLFSNNEPLLDPFLLERLEFTRIHLPNAFIFIYTNGILLTPEKLMQLLPYVDFIHINNYNTDPQLLPSHQRLQTTLITNQVSPEKVEIHLRNKTECLSTRGGQAPNRTRKAVLSSPCILPFSQMVIRPSGQVSFCCNDAYGLYTMGDVSYESLTDIWYGKAFQKSRENMLKSRSFQKPCTNCDMLFMPLACENNNTKVNKS